MSAWRISLVVLAERLAKYAAGFPVAALLLIKPGYPFPKSMPS